MVIREGNDIVEIEAVDQVPADMQLQSAGDTKFSVEVSSNGFRGQGFAWVTAHCIADFTQQLHTLEKSRQGVATLETMEPQDFWLQVRSVTRRGHMAISGKVFRSFDRGEAGPYRHALEFAFEFDPSRLPQILRDFETITKRRSEE